ncbi:hypothetical protein KIH77_01260 [Bifidobacterium sp. 82T24]|uniref:hypothetical protein n=1 Tax=Bifidobacterium pluvialisilvae TaxID=2834436 RepID=UPI001C586C3F|nr:hypothetical protein [Bifidobacterium pluvialisilvae]MBW3087375.1 hypothetical protein [Bifidobacterium pluvialisilvae]
MDTYDSRELDDFRHPGVWNAPATYWFWHRVPTEDEIDDQIRRMNEAGYRSFQIQARMSMPLDDYLGDDYLRMCRHAADVARRCGMMMGIYDEYNWLSGHAGGRVVAGGHDELRERHLFHVTADVDDSGHAEGAVDGIHAVDVDYLLQQGRDWVFEGGRPQWDQWRIVAAVAHVDDTDGATKASTIIDVTDHARLASAGPDGCAVKADLAAGSPSGHRRITFLVAARCATSRMINYLDPAAARRFTEVGYEPYARAFGDHLGTTVSYVFFDQPHACFFDWAQNDGTTASTLMYDRRFYDELAREAGERWPRILLSWVTGVGDETTNDRTWFYERYARRGIDAFLGTLNAWCHGHGLKLCGHEVLSHVSSWDPTSTIIADDPRTNFGLDYFGIDAWRDITGVDARNDFPQLSAKFGDSVARSHGRSGCIVEQYFGRVVPGSHFAAGWWELTLGQLRSQAMRHHILGMRQLLMHAFWLTDGHSPADDGAHGDDSAEMFVNPRFDFAPGINYEPWFRFHRRFADESARVSVFLDGCEPLDEVAVLYPLVTDWAYGPKHEFGRHMALWCENLARDGIDYAIIDERDLAQGTVEGGALRLPDGRTFPVLVLPGVQVLGDARSVDVVERFVADGGTLFATGGLPGEVAGEPCGDRIAARLADLSIDRRFVHDGLPQWHKLSADVMEAVRPCPRVTDTTPESGQLWSRRGRDRHGCRRIMLFNDSDRAKTAVIDTGTSHAWLVSWNPLDGAVGEPSEIRGRGVGPRIELRMSPHQVMLLQLVPDGRDAAMPSTLPSGWRFTPCDGTEETPSTPIDPSIGWERQGYPTFCGMGRYVRDVVIGESPTRGWSLILPKVSGSVTVRVNGRRVAESPWPAGPIPLGRAFDEGVNRLVLDILPSAANHYYAGTTQQGDGPAPCGLLAAPVLVPDDGVTYIADVNDNGYTDIDRC